MISFLLRRFRWMLIGAAGKELARRLSERQVQDATAELADRLPDRAVAIADKLPGDILRAAGTAQVAGRTAKRSARLSRDLAQVSRDAAVAPQRARRRLSEMGDEWADQVATDDRSLRARLIAQTRGRDAATDVLLGGRTSWEDEPLPQVPDPVPTGRPEEKVRTRVVRRVQRSYRPLRRSWQ